MAVCSLEPDFWIASHVPSNSVASWCPDLCQPPDHYDWEVRYPPPLGGKQRQTLKEKQTLSQKWDIVASRTRLWSFGRTQKTGSNLTKNVPLVTVLRKGGNLKGAPNLASPSWGRVLLLLSWYVVQPLSAALSAATEEMWSGSRFPCLGGSKTRWRQGPSAAARRFHLEDTPVFRGPYKSSLGPRQEVGTST